MSQYLLLTLSLLKTLLKLDTESSLFEHKRFCSNYEVFLNVESRELEAFLFIQSYCCGVIIIIIELHEIQVSM